GRDDCVDGLQQPDERRGVIEDDRPSTPGADLVQVGDLRLLARGEHDLDVGRRQVAQHREREPPGVSPVVMALVGRRGGEHARRRSIAATQLNRRNGSEVDVRERQVLLQPMEREQTLTPDAAAFEGAWIDDVRVEDVCRSEAVHEQVDVLVVDDHEAHDPPSTSDQRRRARARHDDVDPCRKRVKEAIELAAALREAQQLPRQPATESRADDAEVDAVGRQQLQSLAVVSSREDEVVPTALERPRQRDEVAGLRRVVDVEPDVHGDPSCPARACANRLSPRYMYADDQRMYGILTTLLRRRWYAK